MLSFFRARNLPARNRESEPPPAAAQVGTLVNWTETTEVNASGDKLTTSYAWKNADGTDGKCAQHFEKNAAA